MKKDKKFPKFTGKKKKHFEALMLARSILMEQVKFHTDEALNGEKGSSGERSGMSSHMADLGSDNSRHDMELGLLTAEGDTLELVDEALQRLVDGSYGKCSDCTGLINIERLEVKPHARYCIKCKSLREENGGMHPDF